MKRARLTTAAVATAAACVLAACGGGSSDGSSGSSGSSGGSGGGNSSSAEGFTSTSITVEGDIVKTSAVGYSQKLAELGAKARFERANNEGGVNGRKINYLGAVDNHLDPSQDLSTIKKVVQQDKAFAVVPLISPVLAQGGQFLVQNKVPFYGWGITPAYCNTENGFGFSGCLVPTTADNEIS